MKSYRTILTRATVRGAVYVTQSVFLLIVEFGKNCSMPRVIYSCECRYVINEERSGKPCYYFYL